MLSHETSSHGSNMFWGWLSRQRLIDTGSFTLQLLSYLRYQSVTWPMTSRDPPMYLVFDRHSIRRPWKPYPRTKHEVDRITRCRNIANGHWPFEYLGDIWNPYFFLGGGGRRGSARAPLERAMVVSYRLSIVTIALSVTIRPQFAIGCLRRSNQQGVGHFGSKFRGVPLGVDPWCLGPQRANIPG